MPGFLGGLAKIGGQVAQVAGAGYEGAGQDKAIALQQAFAARAQNRDDLLANIKAQLDAAQAAKLTHENLAPVLGEAGHSAAVGADAGAVAGAQVDPKVAEATRIAAGTGVTAKNVADTAHIVHENQAPVLGEPGFAGAKGAVAGAEAGAQAPFKIQEATARAGQTPMARLAAASIPEMTSSHARMAALETGPNGTPGAIQAIFKKSAMGNYLAPEKVQQYQNDARAWVARDIQLNGRPLTEQALQEGLKTYTHQPGDEPSVDQQKAGLRQQEIELHQALGGVGNAPPSGGNPATGRTITVNGKTIPY